MNHVATRVVNRISPAIRPAFRFGGFAGMMCQALVALALVVPSAQAAILVDDLVGDWGISPGLFSVGAAQWTPTPNAGIFYTQEDQNPSVNFLNPGSGGQ